MPHLFTNPLTGKAQKKLKAIRDEIEGMLTLKIIQPSKSVVDYRALNQITKGDAFPIAAVSNVLDAISSGKLFSKFDLASGY